MTEIMRTVLQAILVQESINPLVHEDGAKILVRCRYVYVADLWYLESS